MKSLTEGNQPSSLPSLPSDIIHDILSELPVKPLARFRCVCKSWNDLLTSPIFLDINYRLWRVIVSDSSSESELQSIDIEAEDPAVANLKSPWNTPILFVGSCYGLLCVLRDEHLFLWNPCTGQYQRLPDCRPYRNNSYYTFYGFGYDESINDYKVVKGVKSKFPDGLSYNVSVYTRKTKYWKRIEDFHWDFLDPYVETGNWDYLDPYQQTGKLVDGFLHWLAINETHLIISLDLANEKFGEVALPDFESHNNSILDDVGVLGGMLCLYCRESGTAMWTIWIMEEYGVKESWTIWMKFNSDPETLLVPLCLTTNGEVVMQGSQMFKYNPREYNFKTLLDLKPLAALATEMKTTV
ncbi:hypothetical protein F0562_006196 [Nyssa sinensis]|uniref:F-box domain-containing protein n=1 Tax=Nyssa sinensis TaxID=561372 RepID=A0A5J5AR04_9ASTE|nr:hypothetical protein F0562_006196 [Nyssa sinensis]